MLKNLALTMALFATGAMIVGTAFGIAGHRSEALVLFFASVSSGLLSMIFSDE